MTPTYTTKVHDCGEFYCEFWDKETGKNIMVNGFQLTTNIYAKKHRANKIAKRIIRAINKNGKFFHLLSRG